METESGANPCLPLPAQKLDDMLGDTRARIPTIRKNAGLSPASHRVGSRAGIEMNAHAGFPPRVPGTVNRRGDRAPASVAAL